MAKRKNPETSLQAYKELSIEQLTTHYAKILGGFKALGKCTADDIAAHIGMDHVQVNRRFVELRNAEIIYNTFEKKRTRRGREAYLHTLSVKGQIVEKKIEKALPGKSISDFSKEIIRVQGELFSTL